MKTTKEMAEVMLAYENGAKIEYRPCPNGAWQEIEYPVWNWGINDYRVKVARQYRPYKDSEELIVDFCARNNVIRKRYGEPFIWLREKNTDSKYLITGYHADRSVEMSSLICQFEQLFEQFEFTDGTPCGILEDN